MEWVFLDRAIVGPLERGITSDKLKFGSSVNSKFWV